MKIIMKRELSKALSSFKKRKNLLKKSISKKYGWNQRNDVNWRIESGYYFDILHIDSWCYQPSLHKVYLHVKPLYIDDLWWDIFEIPENKKEPMSLRGTGTFSISGIELMEESLFEELYESGIEAITQYPDEDIENIWNNIFQKIETEISRFLKENPDPNLYIPEENALNQGRAYKLYALLTHIHLRNKEQALKMIPELKVNQPGNCFIGPKGKDIDYIEAWCNKK